MKKIFLTILVSAFVLCQCFIVFADDQTDAEMGFSGIGTFHVLTFSSGDSNHTGTTDTPWAWDEIRVIAGAGTSSVLDQYVNSSLYGTYMSRNALFIGPGSIESVSEYIGSNVQDGEDSVTGIIIEGENYGALIQNASLAFDVLFGGIMESVAVGGGDYSVEQYGGTGNLDSGNYNPGPGATSTSVSISGEGSGTIASLNFGSTPQQGPDKFYATTFGGANGGGTYSYSASTQDSGTTINMGFVSAEVEAYVNSETLEVQHYFRAKEY